MASKHRLTVNLAESEYVKLNAIAKLHRISLARLGREALIEFLDQYEEDGIQLPLLSPRLRQGPTARSD